MYPCVRVDDAFRITELYTAFERKFQSNHNFRGEYHNFYEMVIVLDGEVGLTAENDVFILRKGQAFFHEPMEFHRLWSEGGSEPHVVFFTFNAENVPQYESKFLVVDDNDEPQRILHNLLPEFKRDDFKLLELENTDDIKWQIGLKQLEAYVLKLLLKSAGKVKREIKSRSAMNYSKAVYILENNIDKNLSIGEIAKMCEMSEVSLKKTFARFSGTGVMKYFNSLKIVAAEKMIKNGVSLGECAEKLGFQNQNYFSAVFKRITGKSPSQFKKEETNV